jgi:hypothetical protein
MLNFFIHIHFFQQAIEKISAMCQSFFKESVQQYIKSIEPVVISQCCEMVKSFWSGHQQSRGEGSNAQLNSHSVGEQREGNLKCSDCKSEFVVGQYHSCSAFQQNNITTVFASPTSKMIGDVVMDINANAAGCSDEQAKVLVPPSATIDSSARVLDVDEDSPNLSAREDAVNTSSTKAKRNNMCDDTTHTVPASPPKKLRTSPDNTTISTGGSHPSKKAQLKLLRQKNFDVEAKTTSQPSESAKSSYHVPSANGTLDISGEDGLISKTEQLNLSALGHKKRALKVPVSRFLGEQPCVQKITLSEFEKDVFFAATKRIRPLDK